MMLAMTPTDRMRTRTVSNQAKLIHEHLEAMGRDTHGLEFDPWKREVDALWRGIFEQISRMDSEPQKATLELIREPWTSYLTHYWVSDDES